MQFSIPYGPVREGRWAPTTSTINWCEEDYVLTLWIAEAVNSVTNLAFVWCGYVGIRNWIQMRHDVVFLNAWILYSLIGLGSSLFHSMLKYEWQLVDELSMIYTTCLMAYATFSHKKSRIFCVFLGISLAATAISITLYYHYLKDPSFHQNVYAAMTITVVARGVWVQETMIKPIERTVTVDRLTEVDGALVPITEQRKKDEAYVKDIIYKMRILVVTATLCFGIAFILWTLDNEFCSNFIHVRRKIGIPWGLFLEFHGIWHILTGIGGYLFITWGVWLRHCLKMEHDVFVFSWPTFFCLPEIVKIKSAPVTANGKESKKRR